MIFAFHRHLVAVELPVSKADAFGSQRQQPGEKLACSTT
jgi:hypothetical protein